MHLPTPGGPKTNTTNSGTAVLLGESLDDNVCCCRCFCRDTKMTVVMKTNNENGHTGNLTAMMK